MYLPAWKLTNSLPRYITISLPLVSLTLLGLLSGTRPTSASPMTTTVSPESTCTRRTGLPQRSSEPSSTLSPHSPASPQKSHSSDHLISVPSLTKLNSLLQHHLQVPPKLIPMTQWAHRRKAPHQNRPAPLTHHVVKRTVLHPLSHLTPRVLPRHQHRRHHLRRRLLRLKLKHTPQQVARPQHLLSQGRPKAGLLTPSLISLTGHSSASHG